MTSTYLERLLDPWREFERMNRLIGWPAGSTAEYPAINIWVAGDDAIVTTEIAGIDRNSIDISVAGNTLTLKGKRPASVEQEKGTCHRHETWSGEFSKSVQLPFNVDPDKVQASYCKGILHISLPRLEADKPRKITIES